MSLSILRLLSRLVMVSLRSFHSSRAEGYGVRIRTTEGVSETERYRSYLSTGQKLGLGITTVRVTISVTTDPFPFLSPFSRLVHALVLRSLRSLRMRAERVRRENAKRDGMGTTRADITGEITSVAASWARESPGFLPASTSFATLRLVSTHLISPPPAGFVHDDNDRKRSECKWRRDEPSQEAEGLGKKITIIFTHDRRLKEPYHQ